MALVDLLVAARQDGQQVQIQAGLDLPGEIDAGYRIASTIADELGWEPLGWKIAGMTEATRSKLGITHPIYGRTFRRFRHLSPARFGHAASGRMRIFCHAVAGTAFPQRSLADV
jgi:2-keto-4-pentenoate hydratase